METTDIKQEIFFDATPLQVYNTLMIASLHGDIIGSNADIEDTEGYEFTIYDGYITGKNISLNKPNKIVQEWRAEEENWPVNHYSIITIALTSEGAQTKIIFEQTGIPAQHAESIAKGWHDFYWEPMKESFLD
jgi:activator of HSP90 ATPase